MGSHAHFNHKAISLFVPHFLNLNFPNSTVEMAIPPSPTSSGWLAQRRRPSATWIRQRQTDSDSDSDSDSGFIFTDSDSDSDSQARTQTHTQTHTQELRFHSVALIACTRSTFSSGCILSSFFSFILTSNKIPWQAIRILILKQLEMDFNNAREGLRQLRADVSVGT
jgi:hypothetical protein